MKQDLGLRVLGEVMNWDDAKATSEFQNIRLMAALKYDSYRDFGAGGRFIESLASWLQQFEPPQRQAAYDFVAKRLVFVSAREIHKLIARFYATQVLPGIVQAAAAELAVPTYLVRSTSRGRSLINDLRRRTLIMGLSDGARVDVLRHHNVGILSNEQIVGSTQIDATKWSDLVKDLRVEINDPAAVFRAVYLIDDFVATGSSFLRLEHDVYKGKLPKFFRSLADAETAMAVQSSANAEWSPGIFSEDCTINIHHYLGTARASSAMQDAVHQYNQQVENGRFSCNVSFGYEFPARLPLSDKEPTDLAFQALTEHYYDHVIHTPHTAKGGTTDMKRGYGGCALPIVLEHNTPNNTIPLLWAETSGDPSTDAPAMRPLFRRRSRHV